MVSFELVLLGASVLLLLSVILSKASGRLGVPALLVFLLIGMIAGSEISGLIYFDDALLAQSLGVVALVFILFAGGLDTEWEEVRPVLLPGLTLATLGVLLTAGLVGAFVHLVLGIPWLTALLLGAIVSCTDAAAVFSVMRSKGVSLRQRLKSTIELESGSNDPMAVFLTIGLTTLKEKHMISWVGLRGAVPIILATFPLLVGLPEADTIFNVVFFVVLTSVLLQGTSIPFVARLLGVHDPVVAKSRSPLEFEATGDIKSTLVEAEIGQGWWAKGKQILDLHLPPEVLFV